MNNEDFYIFYAKNESNFLYRVCCYEEIKELLLNDILYPYKRKYIYFTYNIKMAKRLLDYSNQEFLIVYDRQILLNQGCTIIDKINYNEWNSIYPLDYKKQSGLHPRGIQQVQNMMKYYDYKAMFRNEPTLRDLGFEFEDEAIIKKIIFESGLIHDILIDSENLSDKYEERFNELINILNNK
jgi:hypothetical protein